MAWRNAFIVSAIALTPASAASAQIAEIAKAQASDPLAGYVKASSWVSTKKGPTFVELLIDPHSAALRLRTATNQAPDLRILDSPTEVLKLLADKRMEFLWQPLSDWAGPTLEKMRDEQIARLRAAAARGEADLPPSTTGESTVRPKIRALLQLADFLIDVGQCDEAERMLQQQLATMKVRSDSSWNAIEWFSVAAWIASARLGRDDFAGAIAQYAFIEQSLGNSPFAQNATINRASLLARSGRYADALAAIEPLWVRWSREQPELKVGGSERQFAWIRACALEGLGRHAEAEAAFKPVAEATDTRDPHFVIDSDDSLRLKGRVCLKQTAAVGDLIATQLQDGLSPWALLLFQPAYRPTQNVELWEKIRSDPRLAKLASERMRVLPPELTPALNGWR
jgi:hypothetical protein